MPSVRSTSSTGNPYIDGILTGTRWSSSSISFSFPTDGSQYGSGYGRGENTNAFEAFTAQQQGAVRAALTMFSSVANLTFTEVTETSSTHGTLRYAVTADRPAVCVPVSPTVPAPSRFGILNIRHRRVKRVLASIWARSGTPVFRGDWSCAS